VNSEAFLVRDSDGSATDSLAEGPKKAYNAIRSAQNPSGTNTVKLVIFVDWYSVEAFVDNGVAVLLGLIYPNEAVGDFQVVSDRGRLSLVWFSYTGCKK
jgi:levanbiose-producing levanase